MPGANGPIHEGGDLQLETGCDYCVDNARLSTGGGGGVG